MTNIGIQFERELVSELKEQGYIAIRSAASKFVDVIAINNEHVYIIEAKKTKSTKPRSYGKEIYQHYLLRKSIKNKSYTFLFWIRLRWKKDIVLEIREDGVRVYKKFNSADIGMSQDFAARRNKTILEK